MCQEALESGGSASRHRCLSPDRWHRERAGPWQQVAITPACCKNELGGHTMPPHPTGRCARQGTLGRGVTSPASLAQGEGARDPAWREVPSGGQGYPERASRHLLSPLLGAKMAGAPSGPQSSWVPEGIGGRSWLLEAESQGTVPARWQEGPSGRPGGPQAAAQTVVKPEMRLGTEAGRDSMAGGQAPPGPSSPLGGLGAHSVATQCPGQGGEAARFQGP